MKNKELFIGLEETNIGDFISTCCGVDLSIEPLTKICCGECGKIIRDKKDYIQKPDYKHYKRCGCEEIVFPGTCGNCGRTMG